MELEKHLWMSSSYTINKENLYMLIYYLLENYKKGENG
ncbi:hypothetical protein HMPREF1498_2227 [Fusobacterium sp. CM1]|nr:hypothetical protein HMPREF1498_2227 [Fusobacterium sp. CM1]